MDSAPSAARSDGRGTTPRNPQLAPSAAVDSCFRSNQTTSPRYYRSSEPPPGVPVVEGLATQAEVEDRVYTRPVIKEEIVPVQHVQYVERFVDREVPHVVRNTVPTPKVEVIERTLEIPKVVPQERLVEVPCVAYIDKVQERVQYIEREKIVERPRIILQERQIPIVRRKIEEQTVEVDPDEMDEILRNHGLAAGETGGSGAAGGGYGRDMYHPNSLQDAARQYGYPGGPGAVNFQLGPDGSIHPSASADGVGGLDGNSHITGSLGPQGSRLPLCEPGASVHDDAPSEQPPAQSGPTSTISRPADEVVEVPHVQHLYRTVTKQVRKYVPQPVQLSVPHYKPNSVTRKVHRYVPIPVEIDVTQEYLCPRIQPRYVDVPTPITVSQVVECPVPADALLNKALHDAYMSGVAYDSSDGLATVTQNLNTAYCPPPARCCGDHSKEPLKPMSQSELRSRGITTPLDVLNAHPSQAMGDLAAQFSQGINLSFGTSKF